MTTTTQPETEPCSEQCQCQTECQSITEVGFTVKLDCPGDYVLNLKGACNGELICPEPCSEQPDSEKPDSEVPDGEEPDNEVPAENTEGMSSLGGIGGYWHSTEVNNQGQLVVGGRSAALVTFSRDYSRARVDQLIKLEYMISIELAKNSAGKIVSCFERGREIFAMDTDWTTSSADLRPYQPRGILYSGEHFYLSAYTDISALLKLNDKLEPVKAARIADTFGPASFAALSTGDLCAGLHKSDSARLAVFDADLKPLRSIRLPSKALSICQHESGQIIVGLENGKVARVDENLESLELFTTDVKETHLCFSHDGLTVLVSDQSKSNQKFIVSVVNKDFEVIKQYSLFSGKPILPGDVRIMDNGDVVLVGGDTSYLTSGFVLVNQAFVLGGDNITVTDHIANNTAITFEQSVGSVDVVTENVTEVSL